MSEMWISQAVKIPTANYGYPKGTRNQNRPRVFVDHIMEGWKRTLDGNWRETAGVGVTFAVGRDGSGSQYTSVLDAHWANGRIPIQEKYDTSNRRLEVILQNGQWRRTTRWPYHWYIWNSDRACNAVNGGSISTEHEGFHGDTWAMPMIQKSIELKLATLQELVIVGQPMIETLDDINDDLLVGHHQIDGKNRINCPGRDWRERVKRIQLENIRDAVRAAPVKYGVTAPAPELEDMMKVKRLVQAEGRPEVYEIRLDHVHDPADLKARGFDWGDITKLDPASPIWDADVTYAGVPGELRRLVP